METARRNSGEAQQSKLSSRHERATLDYDALLTYAEHDSADLLATGML